MAFIPISQGKSPRGTHDFLHLFIKAPPSPLFSWEEEMEREGRRTVFSLVRHTISVLFGNRLALAPFSSMLHLTPWCVSSEVHTGSRMHCLPLDSCLLSSSAGHSLGVHAGPDSDCACSRKFLHLFHMLNQSTHSYKSLFHRQGSEQGADSAGAGAVCLL